MRKILLVEDDPSLRDVYTTILSTEAYLLDVASNGLEALEFIKHATYDLILLDLMMPIMNGVGFLQEYSKSEHLHTKVIVMSNLSEGHELNQALKLDVYKSVLKADLSPRQLLTTVRYELEA